MKLRSLRYLVAILCTITICLSSYAEPLSTSDIVHEHMNAFMSDYGIPGAAVAVIDHGKVSLYVFGDTGKNRGKPISPNTLFEIGSLTKLFTTLSLAEAVQNNQVTLNDKLTRYLPALAKKPQLDAITLLQLATYTASLPFKVEGNITTPEALNDYLLQWKPEYPIGTKYRYSNLSIGLLGMALTEKNQLSLDALYQRDIFTRLNMKSAGVSLSNKEKLRLAQGYTEVGIPAQYLLPSVLPAAGSAKASIHDLAGFLAAAAGAASVPKDLRAAMQIAQTPRLTIGDEQLGLAWQITPLNDKNLLHPHDNMSMQPVAITWLPENKQVYNGSLLMDKTGATQGFRSYIAVVPDKQCGIVILTNRYTPNASIVTVGRTILLKIMQ